MDVPIKSWYIAWYLEWPVEVSRNVPTEGESMPLTDTKVRALYGKAQKGESVGKESDGGGLNLQSGKYWRLSYRFNGRQKTLALGVYPAVSLKAARVARDKAKELLAQGIDPSEKKKQDKEEALRLEREAACTFEAVAREWFEKKTRELTPSYRRQILSRLENHLFPFIAQKPFSALKPADILKAVRVTEVRGSIEQAHRLCQLAGKVCRYARLAGYAEFDIASGLTEALASIPQVKHRATLTDPAQVGALMRALDEYAGDLSIKYAMRILPYVFVRSQELRGAEWDEFDFDKELWSIPAGRMKMKRPHVVPLSRQVVKLLQELREWTGHGRLVFPSPFSATRCISNMGLLNALRRMGYGKGEMSIHGFRGMASTLLNESGKYRHDVIEVQLAHGEKNAVRAAYNHAEYLPERRAMMQDWADMLDAMRADGRENSAPKA